MRSLLHDLTLQTGKHMQQHLLALAGRASKASSSSSARRKPLGIKVLGGVAALFALVASLASASDWPQWRGPHRDGISQETGFRKEWPKEGPALVWKATAIGRGYSTPALAGDRLYLLGSEGMENEFVEAVSVKDGKKIWSTRIGAVGIPKQQPNFPTARSTPTVEGEVLYALGSDGDLACIETGAGKIKWKKSLRTDFGGKPGHWAYAESPLLDGDTLVCTPGGSQATLLALNKNSGELLWKCPLAEADDAAYSSAIVVEAGGIKQYVQLLQKGLVGVDAKTGKFLWRYSKPVSAFDANIPTPVASDGIIYVGSAGTGGGAVKLNSEGGTIQPEQLYFGPKYPTAIGGAVKVGNYLYGATGQALQCIEFTTGQVKWEERSIAPGSLCYADGLLFVHGENGDVALVQATPDGYREKGRFSPPSQPPKANAMEKAWTYPVAANGRLYIRDHDSLWCYAVK
jgi:outer membrane protein assembly factor BamB